MRNYSYHEATSMKVFALLMAMSICAGAVARAATSNETLTTLPEAQSLIEVVAAADAIVAAFGRHDPKAYFALFAPEATFVFHTSPRRLDSRAEYEAEWAKWEREDGFRVRSCRSTDQKAQLFGDVAVFSHSTRTEMSTKQGDDVMLERETIIFHRREGRWVAVHEHVSLDPEQKPVSK
jgi:ketosteroid isomerase-like protein